MFDGLKSMSPQKKKRLLGVGIVALVVGLAVVVAKMSEREPYRGLDTTTEVDVLLPKKKDTTLESVAGQVLALEKRTQELERYVRALEPNLKELLQTRIRELGEQKVADEEKRLQALEQKVDMLVGEMQKLSQRVGSGVVPPTVKVPPPVKGEEKAEVVVEEEAEESVGELRVVGMEEAGEVGDQASGEEAGAEKAVVPPGQVQEGGVPSRDLVRAQERATAEVYIPSGSIIQGVLLSGIDAPTGRGAPKNPVPALVRIKHTAILPNRFHSDVRECFVIVSGYGSLSSERANLRTERLSCVRPDGGVVETQLDGWVIGEDGKAGMRGRLVSKQGRVIAHSLVAGVLSGLANSFRPTQVPVLDITPGSTSEIQWASPQGVLASMGLGGAGSALEKIAEYYMDLADQMFPVIEVDAGRKVTIVLVRGTKLAIY